MYKSVLFDKYSDYISVISVQQMQLVYLKIFLLNIYESIIETYVLVNLHIIFCIFFNSIGVNFVLNVKISEIEILLLTIRINETILLSERGDLNENNVKYSSPRGILRESKSFTR